MRFLLIVFFWPEVTWCGFHHRSYNLVEHYGKRIKILHGCPFEGWPNRAWPIQPISWFLPKRVGWPCPVRSALERTPVQDFNSSIMLYYIIITTYQKTGDLFCSLIFLDFRSVRTVYQINLLDCKFLGALESHHNGSMPGCTVHFYWLKFWQASAPVRPKNLQSRRSV